MKKITKILALLLAFLFVATALAGCNRQEETEGDEYVYIPTYMKLPFEFYDLSQVKIVGDKVYFLASVSNGTKTNSYNDADGNEISYEYEAYVTKLFTMNVDGTDAKELSGYSFDPDESRDDTSYTNIYDILVDNAGNINIVKMFQQNIFDLPDDFNSETDNMWEYYTGNTSSIFIETLDGEGNITETKEIYKAEEDQYINAILRDDNGNFYIALDRSVIILDPEGKELYNIDAENYINNFISLSENRIGFISWGESGLEIKILDNEKKDVGEAIPVPDECYDVLGSSEKYDLIYNGSSGVYGYSLETQEKEKLLDWLDADINQNYVTNVSILENGNIFCVTRDWSKDTDRFEIATVEKKNASEVPEKKIITMATMYTDYNVRNMVLDFNKTNTEYRIKVTDYSEFNTDEDYTAGMTKLNTEIISGNVPDIICTNDFPVTRYSAKGLLEDLTPYIEETIGMENLVEPFFNALKDSEGKLYEIYASFSVVTAVGLSNVVGDGSSWNFDDLNAAMEKLKDGATVFDPYYTKSSAFFSCVSRNISDFLDWETGECRFDSEEFMSLLEFANSFASEVPEDADYNYGSSFTRILSGEQLLMMSSMYNFDDFRGDTFYQLGKDISFVGFPTLSGNGNTFNLVSYGYAMSSKCEYKDVVWDFISEILSEEYQTNEGRWSIPTNKVVFDKVIEEARTPTFSEYAEKEYNSGVSFAVSVDGDTVSSSPNEPAEGSVSPVKFAEPQINEQGWYEEPKYYSWDYVNQTDIRVYAMTDLEYNAIMDLINNTTSVSRYDEHIIQIINEEVQAYFQGQKSVEDTAKMIQSRVKLYVNEQK